MKVQCPTCKQDVEWTDASTYRPFCSKKCQLIDLGDWASEENRIADKSSPQADQVPDIETIEAMLAEQGDDFFKH